MKIPFFHKKKSDGDDLVAYLSTDLVAIIRPAIELGRTDAAAEPALGTSKIGGLPHLPADFVWPCFEGESYDGEWANRPLAFIAQLDLAAVAPYDQEKLLPASGFLYFFYDTVTQPWGFDPSDEGCARVYYFDVPADRLTVTPLPADMADEAKVPLSVLSFGTMDELPDYEEFRELTDSDRFGEDFDWDSYDEAVEKVIELSDASPDEVCKLLGYADLIQGSMLRQCARIGMGLSCGSPEDSRRMTPAQKQAAAEDANNRILLAQFGTLSEEILFGDCGCIYFYIRREDLAARNFDRVWLCLQCG